METIAATLTNLNDQISYLQGLPQDANTIKGLARLARIRARLVSSR